MSPAADTSSDEDVVPYTDDLDKPNSKGRGWLYFTLSAIAILVVAWLYVLFFYRPALLIDEIADKKFPHQAEKICAASRVALDELPFPNLAKSAAERADNLAESNLILRVMIADLREIAPDAPKRDLTEDAKRTDPEAIQEWLDDWGTYISDREQYVDSLRKDPRARFLESPKGDGPKGITRAIDGYAQVNEMNSCTTLQDVS